MSTLATFLLAITGSVAARVLTSLGIGVFSYAAITALLSTVVASFTASYQSIGSVTLNLLNLAGAGQAFGIVLSALVVRASLLSFKKLRVL